MAFLSEWLEYLPDFLPGMLITLELTVSSLLLGLPLGVLLAVGSSSRLAAIKWPTILLVELGRGAPGLIVLYLAYFGFPQAGLSLEPFAAATVALGITTAAYTGEIFRAGISAVPVGHREAARALGLSSWKELRLVVLPQAIRLVVPPLVGFSILLYQGTSLAYVISVPELLSRAYNTATISYQFTAALTLAGVMYAAVSLAAVALLRARLPRRRDGYGWFRKSITQRPHRRRHRVT